MAKETEAPLTGEALQERIAQVELQTKMLNLRAAERANRDFEQRDEINAKQNAQRQKELAQLEQVHEANVRACRHKSGGRPGNILKGGGVGSFSTITRTLMPDGVTVFLQCARCRMRKYTPEKPVKPLGDAATKIALAKYEAALTKYADDLEEFNELHEQSVDAGFDNFMRGPTFAFKTAEGVPFIPARV